MNAHVLQASVIEAPLAAIDRRSLSQAWYSALHLARGGNAQAAPASRRAGTPQARSRRVATSAFSRPLRLVRTPAAHAPVAGRAPARGIGNALPSLDRREPRTALAARIERALRPALQARGGVVVRAAGTRGRIVLFVRRRPGRVWVVAVCAPSAERTVRRALAQARYSLAARGIALDAAALPCENAR